MDMAGPNEIHGRRGASFRSAGDDPRSDDTEEPYTDLEPSEDVYSFLMFASPTEEKKEGTSNTTDVWTAYLLVFINVAFQIVLLYAVFSRVVLATENWRADITDFGGSSSTSMAIPTFGKSSDGCSDGSSLCMQGDNGIITCAPPSVQLTSRWDELDLNGDGIWSREEAITAREDIKCRYVVDSLEVFEVFAKTVVNREEFIWVHPDVRNLEAIAKPYFTYASGDIAMCGYRDQNMCGNLLQRGFFDAALEFGTVPRVGNTVDSAMEYCRGLLKPGGFCDTTLPSTYTVWKVGSAQECHEPDFEGFTYEHPKTKAERSFVVVDYEARMNYERTQAPLFLVFLYIILVLWFSSMCHELKTILILFQLVKNFPSNEEFGEDAVLAKEDEDGEVGYTIQGISDSHRRHICFLTLVRFFMLGVLTWVGCSLLLKSPSYMDILMDAVALVFILEIAGMLYVQVLRPQLRQQVENISPMSVRLVGSEYLTKRPHLVDVLWLFSIFIVVACVMHVHYTYTVDPLYAALKCTCLKVGETCHEALHFGESFWHQYWKHDTPQVFADVAKMKGESGATHLLAHRSSNATQAASVASGAFATYAGGMLHQAAQHMRTDRRSRHRRKGSGWLKGPWTDSHSK